MRKTICILCAFILMLSLSGCSMPDGNIDTLLSPPAPTGELRNVWQVLQKSAGTDITLKYPSSGEYRSAIIEKDLNSDGTNEAVAFYSTTLDNITTMHISLIAKNGDKWLSGGDASLVATGIEKVEFADINGDGTDEIVVSWDVYSGVQRSIGVYSAVAAGLTTRILESQTAYICKDFDSDSNPDILIINRDPKKAVSTAKLLDLTSDGVKEIGSCVLDAAVTEYLDPVTFTLQNKVAVYIDGIKGTGMITEMLIIEDGVISNLSFSENTDTAFDTFRPSSATVFDINGDGNYDIPISYLLTQSTSSQSNNIYKTNWYSYNGEGILLTISTIMNYPDGYFLEIPEKWDASITASINSTDKTLSLFRIDANTGSSAELLLKIHAIPKDPNLVSSYQGSSKIGESDSFEYYASLGTYEGPEAITKEELNNLFKIIS